MNASFGLAVVATSLGLLGAQQEVGSALRFFAIADRGFIGLYGDPAPPPNCRVFLRGEEVRFGLHLVNETGRAQPITPPDNLEQGFAFNWLVHNEPPRNPAPPYPKVRISLGGGVLVRNRTRDVFNPSSSSDVPRTRVTSIPDGQLLRWDVRMEHSDSDAAVVYDVLIEPRIATNAPQLPAQPTQFCYELREVATDADRAELHRRNAVRALVSGDRQTAADEIAALERVHALSFVIPLLRGDLAATAGDTGAARELYLSALAILQERRDRLFFERPRPDPDTAIQEVQSRLQRLSE